MKAQEPSLIIRYNTSMDTKTEQNLAASMTADTTVIIPYLAY